MRRLRTVPGQLSALHSGVLDLLLCDHHPCRLLSIVGRFESVLRIRCCAGLVAGSEVSTLIEG